MDSEGLLQCPYDKNHMIRPSRFPYHLVKCRENNQAAAKVLATCPFNARHRVPKKELELHMQTCESKCPLEPLPAPEEIKHKAETVSCWQSPPCDENWEDESSSTQSTFVLQEYGNYQPYISHESAHHYQEATYNKPESSNTITPRQGGHGNIEKPAVTNGSCRTSENVKSAVGCQSEHVAPYQNMWASTAAKPMHGRQNNHEKPAAVSGNPWCTNQSVNRTEYHPDPVTNYNNEWPSTAAKPMHGRQNNYDKPAAVSGNPWCTNRNVNRTEYHPDPVTNYNNEWPSLGNNRTFKDQRPYK